MPTIKEEDKKYSAFEANRRLYQFRRIPFGVTNGVAAFQRTIDNFTAEENLTDTVVCIDNVTLRGRDQKEHDDNLERFLEAANVKILLLMTKNQHFQRIPFTY